jgi:hypothetical protein
VNSDAAVEQPLPVAKSDHPRYVGLRVLCWAVALALGAAQAWATRFTMNPDGVSYLDIGDAYWHHDWHNAVNAYWSPLYSWILGFFINVLKPTPYWEYPFVHLVNFVIYAAALGCFDLLLSRLLECLVMDESRQLECWWYCLGQSLFIATSLVMIGLNLVSPDMLVAAFAYLTAALMLDIYAGAQSTKLFLLGAVLGFGYLAKTVLLPVGIVSVLSLVWFLRRRRRDLIIPILVGLSIAGPYVALCSGLKHRFTIGESARWNYLVFVNKIDPFFPSGAHTRQLLVHPAAYDFNATVEGTYPPWRDPSYWQDGIQPKWDSHELLERLRVASFVYLITLISPHFSVNLTVGFWLFALLGAALTFRWESVLLLVPCLAALFAYAPLLVELRYVAPFLCMVWLIVFLSFVTKPRTTVKVSILFVAMTNVASAGFAVLSHATAGQKSAAIVQAIEALQSYDLKPGDKIALISTERWMQTAGEGSYIPRLLRVRIISEITEPDAFWGSDERDRSAALEVLKNTGAKGVLLLGAPKQAGEGWTQLAASQYYYHSF